jgi:uncharacterized membrane protein YqjE
VSDGTSGGASSGGLRRLLARASVAGLDLLRTRFELASIEFAEERERAKASLVLVVIAALFCAIALLALSALVVLCFWDTHRLAAMAAVTATHLAIGVGAIWRLKVTQRSASAPFAQTLAELERDREWLAAMVHDRHDGPRGPR